MFIRLERIVNSFNQIKSVARRIIIKWFFLLSLAKASYNINGIVSDLKQKLLMQLITGFSSVNLNSLMSTNVFV